ncbi:SCO family protein [Falsiroseomonas sp. HC035]|uniref:SCO family protein n=1 Tax=Falsiroseomonas sp. HC035 TaxID=3390999 RepID=UPI003D322782
MLVAIRVLALILLLFLGGLWTAAWLGRDPDEGIADAFLRRIGSFVGADMPAPSAGGVQLPQGLALGGPFSLVDQSGKPVTEADFAGRFLLVYFGFTYCPDVCPTELGTIATAIDALEEQGAQVTPMLITIDPERDTPEALADYVSRFHPRMVGLTGSPEQVAAAARAYRVYYAKAQRPEMSAYLMDHSSFIYLVGPDGRVRTLFRPETTPEAIAQSVRAHLRPV